VEGKVRERLHAILNQVQRRFPGGCEIFLANIYDPTDSVGMSSMRTFCCRRGPMESLRWKVSMPLSPRPAGLIRMCICDLRALFLGHGMHCEDRRIPIIERMTRAIVFPESGRSQ